MIQRALASKGVVAYLLACATGIALYSRMPFPEDDLMLHLIELRAPIVYLFFKYSYTLFLFTTPYIAYSLVLSGLVRLCLSAHTQAQTHAAATVPRSSQTQRTISRLRRSS